MTTALQTSARALLGRAGQALVLLWRTPGLAALGVLLVAVALLHRPPAPEPTVTVVLHQVPVATATHGTPGVAPTIIERILWRTVKPDTIWMTAPDLSPLRDLFCHAVLPAPVLDTGTARPAPPTVLLLTAGTLEGRALELYGVRSDAALWRQATTLHEDHGGVRWRADGDSVVVRERRRFTLLGLRPTLGAGGGLLIGLDARAQLGGFVGVVLAR